MALEDQIEALLAGELRSLARLISAVEDRRPGYQAAIDAVYPHTGKAIRVGITGPPGAGKSTLVDQLVPLFRRDGRRVGILASDPTSPFSGGALLGDRVRMHGLADDEGVFIRSLATRGSLGGLARVSHEASLLLEAAGFEVILYETIGVGQAEIDVIEAADSVVVVLTPQSGDAVQALKAGLMEIADLFVVNKADQVGADRAAQALHMALRSGTEGWTSPIIQTIASQGDGVDRLHRSLTEHLGALGEEGLERKRSARLRSFIRATVEEALRRELWDDNGTRRLASICESVLSGETGPYAAAERLLGDSNGSRLR